MGGHVGCRVVMEAVEVGLCARGSWCCLGALESKRVGGVAISSLGVRWKGFVVSGPRRRSRGR